MKKNIIWISLACIVISFILIGGIYLSNRDTFEILVKSTNKCSGEKYYFNYKNKDVYIDCLDSILIKRNGKKYDLKDALNKNIITLEQILKISKKKHEYWDGGSTLYKYKDFSIIVYQKQLEDNKYCNDIIISNKDASINDYCN